MKIKETANSKVIKYWKLIISYNSNGLVFNKIEYINIVDPSNVNWEEVSIIGNGLYLNTMYESKIPELKNKLLEHYYKHIENKIIRSKQKLSKNIKDIEENIKENQKILKSRELYTKLT